MGYNLDEIKSRVSLLTLFERDGIVVKKLGTSLMCCCPFHQDKTPSCKVDEARFHCFGCGAGGDIFDFYARRNGVDKKEAFAALASMAGVEEEPRRESGFKTDKWKVKEPAAPKKEAAPKPEPKADPKKKVPLGDPVAVYDYHDAAGKLAHQTLRYVPKTFRQRRPGGEGEKEWVWTLTGAEVFPYRLPELLAADKAKPVFLCEGEKDVENLLALSMPGDPITATTLPMGAGKWREEFAQWFAGRWVVILADDDEAGITGAEKIAAALADVAERIGVLTREDFWPGGEAGGDVSDWLEWGWGVEIPTDTQRDELLAAAMAAQPRGVEWYQGAVYPGDRGGLQIHEDLMARHLVAKEGLIYCGDHFWRYEPAEGRWEKLREKTWVKRRVRSVLTERAGGKLITDSRVNSIVSLAKSERVKFPEQLNAHPEGTLPLRNGLLDVDTGKLHAHLPGHYITAQTPHNYDKAAKCPEWVKWLSDRHADEETVLQIQEIFGYCLFPHINYHSFFFMFGEGGTGKSTCVDVLEWLIGSENKVSLELTELNNPFLRSQLVGRSLYLAKELTTKSLQHIGLIKAIVSGDPISVDVKYGEGFDFRPRGRLVMESNVVAATPDSSGGFERRFIQINWEKEFDRKKIIYGFQDRFKAEMPGILNWSIEGYKRLRERGRFAHTARSEQATTDLMKHRAQVSSFIKEGWLTEMPNNSGEHVTLDRIFELYLIWCEENDVVAFYEDKSPFGRELFARRPQWRDRKKRVYEGASKIRVLLDIKETRPEPMDIHFITSED